MTVDESLAAFAPVLARAAERGWWRRAYVSTAFGCPYTGRVDPSAVVAVGRRLLDLGADEICFGDTIGVGVPDQVTTLTEAAVAAGIPIERIAYHFHDTRGHGAGQRRRRPRRRRPLLRLGRPAGRAAAPTPRERPATSRPRTSCTSSTRPAGSTASASTASWRPPDSSRGLLGRPLATKVGQAGGWDPRRGLRRAARLNGAPLDARSRLARLLLSSRRWKVSYWS